MTKAQHPKASIFVRQNLFSELDSFEELERRIVDLPDTQARGNAFEVFAEAYLATNRKQDAAKVWPLASAPSQTLQKLGLGGQDYGVDGVFQTVLGDFSVYQVKFRTGRPALTWRELSTFMGLSDSPHIRHRVLFTNCDELPAVINERQGFFCIRGSDLDRMDADDFRAIEAWLEGSDFTVPRKEPMPHQQEALDALLPALEINDRVSAIMACGTGKTLMALWIAERRQASRILVLVPSLALLRQTLHEWMRETRLPSLAYLCVCSDPTVTEGTDALATAQSDLDFQVSTNPADVRDFLDAPFDGPKIVFSTYQSAQVIGEALQPDDFFDLAVFDEAHKTAGSQGRNYAFALEDTNLPIRKRLFLTATPRHYNPKQRDREGEAKLVFSMDRPEVYGPQAYRLTFAEAARRNIICGYKVVISVITSEMINNELLSQGEVMVNGDRVLARQVANQIALRDAVEKYGVNKIFTFHRTVKSAASFVADGNEGVRTHLPLFEAFHVNGKMPAARREHEMRSFRNAPCAIMSNARCLTEGVDVPAVDMVAFLSPRRSRVDIVQATGRAMRRAPGKTIGYILVPLYVEFSAEETVEEAVSRADFDEVWDVLNSLQEQDEVLAEFIRKTGERKGKGLGVDDWQIADRIEVNSALIGLDTLRAAVAARSFDNLYDTWDISYGKLKAFKERFGHCKVPQKWPEDIKLGIWVHNQQIARKRGTLLPHREILLDEIGFNWSDNHQPAAWDESYERLKAFKKQFGHCDVNWTKDSALSRWIIIQRVDKDSGKLLPHREALLDKIGFDWGVNYNLAGKKESFEKLWNESYNKLKTFRRQFGHFRVPKTRSEDVLLGRWVMSQRVAHKKGKLSPERKALLDEIDFEWVTSGVYPSELWERSYEKLKAFKERFGHCNVPQNWKEDGRLGNWVVNQRVRKKSGKLCAEQRILLDKIGFSWVMPKGRRRLNE
jgi:predicted helicase